MAGVIDSTAVKTNRLVRFGYAHMTVKSDGLLFDKGETVPIHEFHYWDASDCGGDFDLVKPISNRSWHGGFNPPTLYAGFPHLYFAGTPTLAERFVSKSAEAMR
jgi:cobyrinic acid a,c-diamide synthase